MFKNGVLVLAASTVVGVITVEMSKRRNGPIQLLTSALVNVSATWILVKAVWPHIRWEIKNQWEPSKWKASRRIR